MWHIFLDDMLKMPKELRCLLITVHIDLDCSFDEIDHSRVRQYVRSSEPIEERRLLFHITEVSRRMHNLTIFDCLQQLERIAMLKGFVQEGFADFIGTLNDLFR